MTKQKIQILEEVLGRALIIRKHELASDFTDDLRDLERRFFRDSVHSLWTKYEDQLKNTPEEVYLRELVTHYTNMNDPASIESYLNKSIVQLGLTTRTQNALLSYNYHNRKRKDFYVGELVQESEGCLFGWRNIGDKSIKEIKDKLHEMGLTLGMDIDYQPPVENDSAR